MRNTAGVSRSQFNGSTYDNVAVRGILVENRTSYRLNGSLPTINLVDLPLENKDRVEVLKGVGALYYGFAPPSGIINLVTKRPDRDLLNLEVSATNHGSAKARGRLERAASPTASACASTARRRRSRPGSTASTASASWPPPPPTGSSSDAVTLRLDAEYVYKDISETSALQLLPAAQGFVPDIPDPTLNFGGRDLRYAAFANNVLARVDWRLSRQWALTVEGGQAVTERDRDFSQLENYGGPTGDGVLRMFRTRDQKYRNRNARAELAGVVATGPVTHNLIAGLTTNWRFQNGRNSTAVTARRISSIRATSTSPSRPSSPPPRSTSATPAPMSSSAPTSARSNCSPASATATTRAARPARPASRRASTCRNGRPRSGSSPSRPTTSASTPLISRGSRKAAPRRSTMPMAATSSPPAVSKQYELGAKAELSCAPGRRSSPFFRIDRPFAFTDPADNVFKLAGASRYRGDRGIADRRDQPRAGRSTPRASISTPKCAARTSPR